MLLCVCCKLLSLMPSHSLQSPGNGVAVRRTRCCGWNATRPPRTPPINTFCHELLAAAAVAAAVSRSHWPAAAPRFPLQRMTVIARPPSRSSGHQLRTSIYPSGRSLGLENPESLRRTSKRAATRLFSNGWPPSVGHTVRSYQRRRREIMLCVSCSCCCLLATRSTAAEDGNTEFSIDRITARDPIRSYGQYCQHCNSIAVLFWPVVCSNLFNPSFDFYYHVQAEAGVPCSSGDWEYMPHVQAQRLTTDVIRRGTQERQVWQGKSRHRFLLICFVNPLTICSTSKIWIDLLNSLCGVDARFVNKKNR